MDWPDLIVEELLRCGVNRFYIAPGSRSTPLVSAIARSENTSVCIHFDERGTAFAALGYARATGKPAVWITTSGTAVANGLPAVVEASVDGVPMILLTADRPVELRDTGANQTIIQPGIFGTYTRWFFELPVSDSQIDPAFVLTTVDQAVHRAVAEKGPVHLNCLFRKPLESDRNRESPQLPKHLSGWSDSTLPYTTYAPTAQIASDQAVEQLRALLSEARRPAIVLGRVLDTSYEKNVVDWAAKEGIPVMPDVSSPFRVRCPDPPGGVSPVIPFWDLLMSKLEVPDARHPDLIIQFGRGIVSSRFDKGSTKRVIIDSAPNRLDPGHRVILRIQVDSNGVVDLVEKLEGEASVPRAWLSFWQSSNKTVAETLLRWLEKEGDVLTEEAVAHVLPASCGFGNTLVLGNSLSVRNADQFAAPGDNNLTTILNRGASGIDGTIAVSAGVAAGIAEAAAVAEAAGTAEPTAVAGSAEPTAVAGSAGDTAVAEAAGSDRALNRVIVLLGDQALLHDLNSLALASQSELVVVVVNNNGGRIFHRLPVSSHEDIFEPYFVDPHGRSFEHAAALFDIKYEAPESISGFQRAVKNSLAQVGATLIEIRIDYNENELRRQKLRELISHVLSADLPGNDQEADPHGEPPSEPPSKPT